MIQVQAYKPSYGKFWLGNPYSLPICVAEKAPKIRDPSLVTFPIPSSFQGWGVSTARNSGGGWVSCGTTTRFFQGTTWLLLFGPGLGVEQKDLRRENRLLKLWTKIQGFSWVEATTHLQTKNTTNNQFWFWRCQFSRDASSGALTSPLRRSRHFHRRSAKCIEFTINVYVLHIAN